MQRRDFLKFTSLIPLTGLMNSSFAAGITHFSEVQPDGKPHTFTLSKTHFLLDNQPIFIRSGEIHPIRVPAEYWEHRILMCKAMGLNTIAIYLMWNAFESEPGKFDFTTGNRNFEHFIDLCAKHNMWVYLRPGPYVCAEWDMGGIPPYLLRNDPISVRDRHDTAYMEAVTRYFDELAPRIAPRMVNQGGPILMVQIENEYASFGEDVSYLEELRQMWIARGITGPFTISDGLGALQQRKTWLSGAAVGLDGDLDFATAEKESPNAPVWVGEGYTGWLTHWGDPKFQVADYSSTLKLLLDQERSFNLYVVHGGTNFGFGAGSNAKNDYNEFQPDITSYDYGAPINERGEPTADYYRFRELIKTYLGKELPPIPDAPPVIEFASATLKPWASVWENLPTPKTIERPIPNELLFAQDHGMVVYQRAIPNAGELVIDKVRDYATIHLNGNYVDYLSRTQNVQLHPEMPIKLAKAGDLSILVDSFGHINYGLAMVDRKGILGEIKLNNQELTGWQVYSLPLSSDYVKNLTPLKKATKRPGIFFHTELELNQLGDTFFDMSDWDKGYIWVNGHLLGRYWHIGPQQRLFCPASWLKQGKNTIIVLDFHRTEPTAIYGKKTLV